MHHFRSQKGLGRDMLLGALRHQLLEQDALMGGMLIHQDQILPAVVDRDQGGTERPISNLSGGETFMVSLALALGLEVFTHNRRQISLLDLDVFGTCAFVEVGAFGVAGAAPGVPDRVRLDAVAVLSLSVGSLGLCGGQFDDLDGAAHRILFDDDPPPDRRNDSPPCGPRDAVS